jgi:hypothetical protein
MHGRQAGLGLEDVLKVGLAGIAEKEADFRERLSQKEKCL